MGHLDTQRSLPTVWAARGGLSSLAKKLRLTAEHSVAVLNAPDLNLARLRLGPRHVQTALEAGRAYDAVLLFVRSVDELRSMGPPAIHAIRPGGMLWIAYPKGGKTVGATDLPATPWWVQRDVLGEITSETGYKAVSFVAVDDVWTALRFKHA